MKQLLGRSAEDNESKSADSEPLIVAYRLAYRPFLEANGWETVDTWDTWTLDTDRRLPLTKSEFLRQLDAGDPLGHYKLFPVDENSRLQSAEWGVTHGTEAEARNRQQLREQQQTDADQDNSGSMPISPAAWEEMQETFSDAAIEWDRDDLE